MEGVLYLGVLVAQMVKNLPGMQETQVLFLGRQDRLEREWLATYRLEDSIIFRCQFFQFDLLIQCNLKHNPVRFFCRS